MTSSLHEPEWLRDAVALPFWRCMWRASADVPPCGHMTRNPSQDQKPHHYVQRGFVGDAQHRTLGSFHDNRVSSVTNRQPNPYIGMFDRHPPEDHGISVRYVNREQEAQRVAGLRAAEVSIGFENVDPEVLRILAGLPEGRRLAPDAEVRAAREEL